MGFVSKINRTSVLLFAFAIISGGSAVQVSAATEKPVTKPSLLSVCVNPAKTQTRAAQDDRCTDKNTGTIYESLPSKTAKSSSPKKILCPLKLPVHLFKTTSLYLQKRLIRLLKAISRYLR